MKYRKQENVDGTGRETPKRKNTKGSARFEGCATDARTRRGGYATGVDDYRCFKVCIGRQQDHNVPLSCSEQSVHAIQYTDNDDNSNNGIVIIIQRLNHGPKRTWTKTNGGCTGRGLLLTSTICAREQPREGGKRVGERGGRGKWLILPGGKIDL